MHVPCVPEVGCLIHPCEGPPSSTAGVEGRWKCASAPPRDLILEALEALEKPSGGACGGRCGITDRATALACLRSPGAVPIQWRMAKEVFGSAAKTRHEWPLSVYRVARYRGRSNRGSSVACLIPEGFAACPRSSDIIIQGHTDEVDVVSNTRPSPWSRRQCLCPPQVPSKLLLHWADFDKIQRIQSGGP